MGVGDGCGGCGTALRGGEAWPTWCPGCDDGVVVNQRVELSSRADRRRDARRRRVDDVVAQQVADGTAGHGIGGAVALATLVHLITLGCVGGVVFLLVAFGRFVAVDLLSALLLAMALVVGPRVPRIKDIRPASELPALSALCGEIAAAVGCAPPDGFRITDRFNAAVSRGLGPRLRPAVVVELGAALWCSLDDAGRVAVLAHELGHAGGGDPARSWWVRSAQRSLFEWERLFQPTRSRGLRISGGAFGLATVAELIVPLALAPITVLIAAVAIGFARVVQRDSRRCEFLADRTAVRVAGSAGMTRALECLALGGTVRAALSSAHARRDPTSRRELVATAVRAVPRDETARRIRREELTGDTGDISHPPIFRRIRMVAAAPTTAPSVVLDAGEAAVLAAELDPLLAVVLP